MNEGSEKESINFLQNLPKTPKFEMHDERFNKFFQNIKICPIINESDIHENMKRNLE